LEFKQTKKMVVLAKDRFGFFHSNILDSQS